MPHESILYEERGTGEKGGRNISGNSNVALKLSYVTEELSRTI
jgi:hypothetical protein